MKKFSYTIACIACFAGIVLAGCETPDGGCDPVWTIGWMAVALASALYIRRKHGAR